MQGDISNPPIIIRSSRWKTGLLLPFLLPLTFLTTLPFVAGLVGEVHPASVGKFSQATLLGSMMIGASLMFLLGEWAYRACFATIKPDQLEMSPNGLSITLAGRRQDWVWPQVSNLRYKPGRGKVLIFGEQGLHSPRAIRPAWEIGQDRIQTLILDAKARWGTSSAATDLRAERLSINSWLSWIAASGLVAGFFLIQSGHHHAVHRSSAYSSTANRAR